MSVTKTLSDAKAVYPFIDDAVAELEELSPLEEAAFPFLHCAVLLDRARSGDEEVDFSDLIEANAVRWIDMANRSFDNEEFSDESREYLSLGAKFMSEALLILRERMDHDLIEEVITLNLQMSESILAGGSGNLTATV